MVMTKLYIPYACQQTSGLLEWPDDTVAVRMRLAVSGVLSRLRTAHRMSLLWY